MTNITLSIEESVYKRMHRYSEIRWSEYVRKMIKKRLDDLDILNKHPQNESIMTMLASEEVLKKDWDNDADDRWNNI